MAAPGQSPCPQLPSKMEVLQKAGEELVVVEMQLELEGAAILATGVAGVARGLSDIGEELDPSSVRN